MQNVLAGQRHYDIHEQGAELPEGYWLIPGAVFGLFVWTGLISAFLH